MTRHMVYYGAAAVASLFLEFGMCYQWGSAGVVWAGTLAFALIHAVPSINLLRKRLRTL